MGSGRGFDLWAVKSGNGIMKRPSENGKAERKAKAKRACTEGVGASGDVEEFLALLERIEATERQFGALPRANNSKLLPHDNKEPATLKPSWLPSFEWEDFCINANGTRDVDPSSSACKAQEGSLKEGNQQCLSPDEKNNGVREGFDLNLPSTPVGF